MGGHFAFLALERACDGKALEGLRFLDENDTDLRDQEMKLALLQVEEL